MANSVANWTTDKQVQERVPSWFTWRMSVDTDEDIELLWPLRNDAFVLDCFAGLISAPSGGGVGSCVVTLNRSNTAKGGIINQPVWASGNLVGLTAGDRVAGTFTMYSWLDLDPKYGLYLNVNVDTPPANPAVLVMSALVVRAAY